MKNALENMKNPVDCEHCGGTGKVEDGVTVPDPNGEPKTYGHHACPVCGGSGKTPGPTIDADERKRSCFVATVAFGDPDCRELDLLRSFRDERLLTNAWGQRAVAAYYRFGPKLATTIDRRPRLKAATRRALLALCRRLERQQRH